MSSFPTGKNRGDETAASSSDVTDDPIVPGSFRVRFDGELTVECEFDPEKGTTFADLQQALQDTIGYTGIEIIDVTEYEEVP